MSTSAKDMQTTGEPGASSPLVDLAQNALRDALYASTSTIGVSRADLVRGITQKPALPDYVLRDSGFSPGGNPLREAGSEVFGAALEALVRSKEIVGLPGRDNFRITPPENDAVADMAATVAAIRGIPRVDQPRPQPVPPRLRGPVLPPPRARIPAPPVPPMPAPKAQDDAKGSNGAASSDPLTQAAEPVRPAGPRVDEPRREGIKAEPVLRPVASGAPAEIVVPELEPLERAILRAIYDNQAGHSLTRGVIRDKVNRAGVWESIGLKPRKPENAALDTALSSLKDKRLIKNEYRPRNELTTFGEACCEKLWPRRYRAPLDLGALEAMGLRSPAATSEEDVRATFTAALGNVVGQGSPTYEAVMAEWRKLNDSRSVK